MSDRVCVDIGANIGISARYFCEVAVDCHVFSFEPLPLNVARYQANMAGIPKSCKASIFQAAIADYSGHSYFASEPTGRYGRLMLSDDEVNSGGETRVQVLHIAAALDDVLRHTGRIDVLKIDIEGMEERVLRAIPQRQLTLITKIFAEYSGSFCPTGFVPHRWGPVTHFLRR